MSDCFLEGCLGRESVYRIPLISFPALVGRESGLAVTLLSGNVSRHHAEFLQQDGELLVRDLDRQTVERQEMIGLLVRLVKKGRPLALAEGVSRAGELAVCRQLDFDLIQGYVYGTPASLEQLESARKCQAGHGWRSAGR